MNKIRKRIKKWMLVSVLGAIVLSMGSVASGQEMVEDPATGKMVSKPVYGGTLTTLLSADIPYWDTYQGSLATVITSYVYEN